MFQIGVNGAATRKLRAACAIAFALGFAGIASADSTEVAKIASADSTDVTGIAPTDATEVSKIASADSTEVAKIVSAGSTEAAMITAANSTEVAVVIPSDDAMPQGPSVVDRLAIIREKIQNALEYPPLARLRESDGDALVRFEIDRSGSARNVRVVRSSGHERLDASAVRAVESADPLPWVYGPLEVPVHFELVAPH